MAVRPLASLVPARLLETRSGQFLKTVDGAFQGIGELAAQTTVELPVTGRGGVGLDAATVSLNVTVTQPRADGFVTVYPCGGVRPVASNVNYRAGQTVANSVITRVGVDGKVCLYTMSATQLIVDVNAFVPASVSSVVSTGPSRLLETRSGPGLTTIDGLFQATGAVPAGGVVELPVIDRGGVGSDAASVLLNVTVTEPSFSGFVTVYPCGEVPPLASNINFVAGQTLANAVSSRVGAGGRVCLYSSAMTHLIVDVSGFVPTSVSTWVSLSPARFLETRSGPGLTTWDGLFQGVGEVPFGTVLSLPVAGRGGVDIGAGTVSLNVTVTDPRTDGFVTVFPCGGLLPLSSNVNFLAGQTVANAVISRVGPDGTICLYTASATQLVVDVNGYAV
jgi:hypothetical protein